ncbi:MAG: hypothetical protein Q8R40_03230 [bacterium]|nr:hypothetical protein [bacterium]
MALYRYAVWGIFIVGTSMLPLISYAFFPSELREMHEESRQKVEERREKFRQDILEKRKEVLNEWRDKRQEIKERFKKERQKIKGEFEIRRNTTDDATDMTTTSGEVARSPVGFESSGDFIGIFERSAKDIMHVFTPFANLFSGPGR